MIMSYLVGAKEMAVILRARINLTIANLGEEVVSKVALNEVTVLRGLCPCLAKVKVEVDMAMLYQIEGDGVHTNREYSLLSLSWWTHGVPHCPLYPPDHGGLPHHQPFCHPSIQYSGLDYFPLLEGNQPSCGCRWKECSNLRRVAKWWSPSATTLSHS